MRIKIVLITAILLTTIGHLYKVPMGFHIGISMGVIIESIKALIDNKATLDK